MGILTQYSGSLSLRRISDFSRSSSSHEASFSPSSEIMRNFLVDHVLIHGAAAEARDGPFFWFETLVIVAVAFGFIALSKGLFTLFTRHINHEDRKERCPFAPANTSKSVARGDHDSGTSLHLRPAYKFPPLKAATSPHMTMGLKRLDHPNWLIINDEYTTEHIVRADLLDNHRPDVLQCLPGSEAACTEVLTVVINFLTTRYPSIFTISGNGNQTLIHNTKTGESFPVHNNPHPLETAARLAMEDLNILVKDPADDQYHLQASATLFPAGWRLQDRIGSSMSVLHSPVPDWAPKLSCSVNRYFDHLSGTNAMERHTVFVQTSSTLFQSSPLNDDVLSATTAPESPSLPLLAGDIYLRRERQTFTPLPMCTGAKTVLFTVHTSMVSLTSLELPELEALVETARNWGVEMARYKGREIWMESLLAYVDLRREEKGGSE